MMEDKYNHAYDDIINLPNPTSKKHQRMSIEHRAAQFSPFAALAGHDKAIQESARFTEEKIELGEDAILRLNEKLRQISETIDKKQTVAITYFVPDEKKSGGAYVTRAGIVKKIDGYHHTVTMTDETVIPMEQICKIEFDAEKI